MWISNNQKFSCMSENNTMPRGKPLEYMLDKTGLVSSQVTNNLESYYVGLTVR